MRVRHKPPTLVSMWMLDVFCCALGCVTLLFLLNSRMASDAVQANRAALLDLAATDNRLAAALSALESTRIKLNTEEEARLRLLDESLALAAQLGDARTEQEETKRKLATARSETKDVKARFDASQTALAATEKKAGATAKELEDARRRAAETTDLLQKNEASVDTLQKLLRRKDEERMSLEARLTAARRELADAEARWRAAQKDLDANLAAARAAVKAAGDELATARTAAAKSGEDLTAARTQIKDLTKKVDDANVTIIDLQGVNAKLADKFDKVQKESDARFAGIAMTGKRVVFLVDMSGSMGKRDLNTIDKEKWPMVIETVCKVMRSIPTLEQYQVIVFSSSANWVFGTGEWQPYTGGTSVATVERALLKVQPQGDTNMHAALEKAFSLRASGLDTVYLFSDGLPTSGPGLTTAQQNLPENERGAILGKKVHEVLDTEWNRAGPGRPKVTINSIGFFFDSVDVGAFLWSLSRANGGSFVGMSRP
jgi:predicted  nucleic acid-binding Zn-ribbon protein